MNVFEVNAALAGACVYADRTPNITAGKTSFTEQLQKAETEELYRKYLEQRFGNVRIQSVEQDQNSMDRIGAETSGTGNVIIAPNILEQMAADPKNAAYYEGKIQHYFDTLPQCEAQLSAMGHEIHSSGIVIHPDGTVTHYVCGDLKPEVRARIEGQIKAEAKAKAKRKQAYQEAAEKWARERRVLGVRQVQGGFQRDTFMTGGNLSCV